MRAYQMFGWRNASFHINRWYLFLYYWEFVGYRPNEPRAVKHMGITYTAWGARRALNKAMRAS